MTVDRLANIHDVHAGIPCHNLHQDLILSNRILTYNSIWWWLSAWILHISGLFKGTFPYLIYDGLLYLSTGIYHLSRVISLHEREVHCHRRAQPSFISLYSIWWRAECTIAGVPSIQRSHIQQQKYKLLKQTCNL